MSRELTDEEKDLHAVEDYYRFRTCPMCENDRMMFMGTADAQKCPNVECGFVLSGLQVRQGSASIVAAMETYRLGKREKPQEPLPPEPAYVAFQKRMEALERRITTLEEHAAYGSKE